MPNFFMATIIVARKGTVVALIEEAIFFLVILYKLMNTTQQWRLHQHNQNFDLTNSLVNVFIHTIHHIYMVKTITLSIPEEIIWKVYLPLKIPIENTMQ